MVLAALVALAYTGLLLGSVGGHANFRGDDFNAFRLANDLPLLDVVRTPSDAHFSPLQRLASYAIFKLAPMNFHVALAVLLTFHLLGVIYLYKTLELIHSSAANVWLCFWYSTNVYLSMQFLGWSSAIHRLPYVLFGIATIYNYLHFRRSRSTARLLACFICWAAAAGFFLKAALLPAVLLGIEVCLLPRTSERDFLRNGLVILGMLLSSAAFVGLSLWESGARLRGGGISLEHLAWTVLFGLNRLVQGCFGMVSVFSFGTAAMGTCVVVLAFLVWSIARAPRSIAVWVAMLVILTGNIVVPELVSRPDRDLALMPQYYFELMFVVVLYLGLVFDALADGVRHRSARAERGGAEDRAPRPMAWRRFAGGLAVCGLMAAASVSYHNGKTMILGENDMDRVRAARFVQTLVGDVAELHGAGVERILVADGKVPSSVLGFWVFSDLARYENFLPLIDPSIEVVDERNASFTVGKDGRLLRIGRHPEATERERHHGSSTRHGGWNPARVARGDPRAGGAVATGDRPAMQLAADATRGASRQS